MILVSGPWFSGLTIPYWPLKSNFTILKYLNEKNKAKCEKISASLPKSYFFSQGFVTDF